MNSIAATPLDQDPVAWFARLDRAVREKDWLLASAARDKLAELGWEVRQCKARKPRQKPRSKGGGQ